MKLLKSSGRVVTVLVCSLLIIGLMNVRASPRVGGVPTATKNGDVSCDGKGADVV